MSHKTEDREGYGSYLAGIPGSNLSCCCLASLYRLSLNKECASDICKDLPYICLTWYATVLGEMTAFGTPISCGRFPFEFWRVLRRAASGGASATGGGNGAGSSSSSSSDMSVKSDSSEIDIVGVVVCK